jgi:hypothetical protein
MSTIILTEELKRDSEARRALDRLLCRWAHAYRPELVTAAAEYAERLMMAGDDIYVAELAAQWFLEGRHEAH